MAKSTKSIEVKKISRGVGVNTPSDQDTPKDPLEEAIVGGINKIFNDLKLDEKIDSIKEVVSSGFASFGSTVELLKSINDKMVALLGAVYGYKGVTETTKSSNLLSRLGNIALKDIPMGGIIEYLDNITKVISDMSNDNSGTELQDLFNSFEISVDTINDIVQEFEKFNTDISDIVLSNKVAFENIIKDIDALNNKLNTFSSVNNNDNSSEVLLTSSVSSNYDDTNIINAINSVTAAVNNITTKMKISGDINIKGITPELIDKMISLSKIKNTNGISAIFSELNGFVEGVNNIKTPDNKSESSISSISGLIQSVIGIAGFDDAKFKELSRNLRKMIKLTADPTMLTSFGLSSTGLLYLFVQSMGKLSGVVAATPIDLKPLEKTFEIISDISYYISEDKLENLEDGVDILLDLTNEKNKSSLFTLISNLSKLGEEIGRNSSAFDEISNIKTAITSLLEINKVIDLKSGIELTAKSLLLDTSIWALSTFVSLLNKIQTDKSLNKVSEINNIINALADELDISKFDVINEFCIKSVVLSKSLAENIILGKLGIVGAKSIQSELEALSNVIANIPKVTKKDSDKAEKLIVVSDMISSLSKSLALAGLFALPGIIGVKSLVTEFVILKTVVDKFNKIEIKESDIKKKGKLLAEFIGVSGIIMMLGALVAMAVDFVSVLEFTVEITVFMMAMAGVMAVINKVASKSDKSMVDLDKMAILIGACALTMIIGGLITTAYPQIFIGAMLFAAELGVFMLAVLGAINLGTKGLKESQTAATKFTEMIAICGAVLIAGAIFNQIPGLFVSALAFTVELGVFMLAVIWSIKFASKDIDSSMKDADKFATLIGVSALVLIIGSLIVSPVQFISAMAFAVELGVFMLAVVGAYNLASKGMQDSLKSAGEFAILIGVSALVLILGSMIVSPEQFLKAIAFTLELGLFMFAIVGVYNLASRGIKDSLGDAKNLAILIGVSAVTLLIGGAFMLIPGMPLAVLEFALMLGLFIVAIVGIFGLFGKQIEKSKGPAIGLSILVGITAAALLTGGYLIMKHPGMDTAIWSFVGATLVMIAGMGTAVWLLGKIDPKSLATGEIALAGIAGIIWLMGKAFSSVTEAAKIMESVKDMEGDLKTMSVVMLAIGGAVAVVAAISAIPGVAIALAIGEGLLAGLTGVVWMMGKAISVVAKSMLDLDKVKDFDSSTIVNALEEYSKIVPYITKLGDLKTFAKLKIATSACDSISNAIYQIAKSVQAMANLSTILYDENGKEIGRRQLNDTDFDKASTNIAEIVTVLGGAIIDVYEKNPDIFTTGNSLADMLGMETPFARVVRSCTMLGNMINLIAEGVKEYANMSAPIYGKDGKIVGRRALKDSDFSAAAENVKKVISVLGGAVLSLYYGEVVDANGKVVGTGQEMFEWKLIGDNPFAMTVKSCTMLGNMINSIAKGVTTYSKLPQGLDFNIVTENIKKVISCLGAAIMSVYYDPQFKDMFTDPSTWHTDADKTPFGMVVKSMSGVGKIISDASDAIKKVNELKLPAGFAKENSALQQKIKGIISCTAQGIMAAYNAHPEWFTDSSWFHNDADDTPFGMVKACLAGTSKLVEDAAKAIQKVLDLKITDIGALQSLVSGMISAIPAGIMNVALNPKYKEYFEDEDGEIFTNISNGFKKFTALMNDVTKAYANISKLGFTIEEGKPNSISSISMIAGKMIYNLPYYIFTEYSKHPDFYSEDGKAKLESIEDAFSIYKDTIKSVTSTYEKIFDSLNKIGAVKDTTPINLMNLSVQAMLDGVAKVLSTNTEGLLSAEAVQSFSNKVKTYVDSIISISKVYNQVPSDAKKYNGLANAIQNMNAEIVKTPDQKIFKEETTNVAGLVRSINSISVTRADKLTKLIDSLNSLGSKFNGLDKFTTVLAGQMSQVLTKLTNSINGSAKIIAAADKIQAKRKAHIDSMLGQVRNVLNTGLDITIIDGANNSNNGAGTSSPTINGGSSTINNYAGNQVTQSSGRGGASGGNIDIDYSHLQRIIQHAIENAGGPSGTGGKR